jgi:hydroxymethylpyrimidine pyrophosphatase-like HAD family hydrolase
MTVPVETDEDFLAVVEKIGLRRVSYPIGWTAWLDTAADGVNKGTAMARIRIELGIPRERVMVVADGHNDIELLRWASESGRGVAMGHAPAEVIAVANELTEPSTKTASHRYWPRCTATVDDRCGCLAFWRIDDD